MTWTQRQAACQQCHGTGYVQSEARHAEGRGAHAWAKRCICQPTSLRDLTEALAEEGKTSGRGDLTTLVHDEDKH